MEPIDRELADQVTDARARTLALVADFRDAQWMGPCLPIVNPPRWEIGHVAWFQERWVLRDAGARPSMLAQADALYDSSAIPHDARWSLPLPTPDATRAYLGDTRDAVLALLARDGGPRTDAERYFVRLATFHEDMHCEALTYTRQTLGYAAPAVPSSYAADEPRAAAALTHGLPEVTPGDARVPGGEFELGGARDEPFVFDNEKWAHPVQVAPFAIARAAVTQGEFARFVDDGGYARRELWSEAGWRWREAAGATHPVYWRRASAGWERRVFDRWAALEPSRAMVHAAWYEAEAYCNWAGRRLPTEVEWEVAALGEPDARGALARHKRRFPWGDAPPDARRANLGWAAGDVVDARALPAGDSAFGCRQMIGNVWEWTATTFGPYPGFVVDPYKEYSQPWFGTHKVLRGGAWATAPRLIRGTWRNFFTPDRRDIWAGFRTCAR